MKQQSEANETSNGFWKRLALAIASLGESHEERLEKRVRRLEAEVSRLSLPQNEQGRADRPDVT